MPKQIVQDYCNIYSDYFMIPTLRNFRQSMLVQAFDDEGKGKGKGFIDRYIIVHFNAESHRNILASSVSMLGSNNQVETCIMVNDNLAQLPKQEQKECLAHEWIHAMMTFREEGRTKSQIKTLSGQPEAALYGYLLASNSLWQDNNKLSKEIKNTLSYLLVSDGLVNYVLDKYFNTNIHQLCDYSNNQDNLLNTIELVTEFTRIFSSRYFVAPEIATKRLIEMILQKRKDGSFLSLKKDFWLTTLPFE
jgi:hypothetical protein